MIEYTDQACLDSYKRRRYPIQYENDDPNKNKSRLLGGGRLSDLIPSETTAKQAVGRVNAALGNPIADPWALVGWTATHLGLHEADAYATIDVLWSEAGLWGQEKAHFLVVKVQHVGRPAAPVEKIRIDLKLSRLETRKTRKQSNSTANPQPLQVVLYGPVQVLGLPRVNGESKMGLKDRQHFGDTFNPGERFAYIADLYQTYRPGGPRLMGETIEDSARGMCDHPVDVLLRLRAFGNLAYREDLPDVTVGMIVLSAGDPFSICSESVCWLHDSGPSRTILLPCEQPAVFNAHACAHIPEGQLDLGGALDETVVKNKLREVCSCTAAFETVRSGDWKPKADMEVFFTDETGHVEH